MAKGKSNSALVGIGAGLIGLAVGAVIGFFGNEETKRQKESERASREIDYQP